MAATGHATPTAGVGEKRELPARAASPGRIAGYRHPGPPRGGRGRPQRELRAALRQVPGIRFYTLDANPGDMGYIYGLRERGGMFEGRG